jgi:hypothetical protein
LLTDLKMGLWLMCRNRKIFHKLMLYKVIERRYFK